MLIRSGVRDPSTPGIPLLLGGRLTKDAQQGGFPEVSRISRGPRSSRRGMEVPKSPSLRGAG